MTTPRYLRALEEYTDMELLQELAKRTQRRNMGICDYCGRFADAPPCKFPTRHRLASPDYGTVDAAIKQEEG